MKTQEMAIRPGGGASLAPEQAWQVLLALPVPLVLLDPDGQVQFLNAQAESLLITPALDVLGRHWSECMRLDEPGGQGDPLENGLPDCAVDQPWRPEGALPLPNHVLTRPDGTQRIVGIDRVPVALATSRCPGEALVLQDHTDSYQRLRRLERQCAKDHLTKLANRREFERRLGNALARAYRDGAQHALMFMDLDRFKQVNDTHGHPVGDAVLKEVAGVMQQMVRNRDTLARLGGDEFGLLMEFCDVPEALRTARTLCRVLSRQHAWCGEPVSVGVSIGLVAVDRYADDIASVLAAADRACYCAKCGGGGGVHLHRSLASTQLCEA